MGDRAERHGAFAQGADHFLAPRLDALGDRDFAFAGEQLDAPHLAEIHADGVVGPADIVIIQIARRAGLGGGDRRAVALGPFLRFLVLDDVDAHLREQRHDVLDLLRTGIVRRHHGVQLVDRDVAAFLALGDQFLDRRRDTVHQRTIGAGFGLLRGFRFARRCLGCHMLTPSLSQAACPGGLHSFTIPVLQIGTCIEFDRLQHVFAPLPESCLAFFRSFPGRLAGVIPEFRLLTPPPEPGQDAGNAFAGVLKRGIATCKARVP